MNEDRQRETVLIARGDEAAAQRYTSHGKDMKLAIRTIREDYCFLSIEQTIDLSSLKSNN